MARNPEHEIAPTSTGAALVSARSLNGSGANEAVGLSLEAAQAKLTAARGRKYWRSLEELADTQEFKKMVEREFPEQSTELLDPVSRRGFLKLMGASMALAGLSACTKQPPEAIVPYVRQPEEVIPGKPLFYATAIPFAGYAAPALVESYMFRPIKVEGNPQHPASQGAMHVFGQAELLRMYDPDRAQTITFLGEMRPWAAFLGAIRGPMNVQRGVQGTGLRILTETVTSPTLTAQIRSILKAYPQAKWITWEPAGRDGLRGGTRMATGAYVDPVYNFQAANIVLSLDSDFLSPIGTPGHLRYARDFISRRKLQNTQEMSRFYSVEATPTNTGGKADHRLPMRASEIEGFAAALLARVGGSGSASGNLSGEAAKFLDAVAKDLANNRGASIVIAGEQASPGLNALALSLNSALGNIGRTVNFIDPVEGNPQESMAALQELAGEMHAGKVEVLLTLGGANPVYTAPADLRFADAMQKIGLRIHHGLNEDETSQYAHWQIPAAHPLESWADCRAYDGTVTVLQPLIEPIYGGKTETEVAGAFTETPDKNAYDWVRDYWKAQYGGADFEDQWRRWLHEGIVPNTSSQPRNVAIGSVDVQPKRTANQLEVIFQADPTIYDGRYANDGWLQELPKPVSKICWDNAAYVSFNYANQNGLKPEDIVEIEHQGRKITAPIWILPGHADNSVTVTLGYGRRRAGRVGDGTGFNAYAIRTSANPYVALGAKLSKQRGSWGLAATQKHHVFAHHSAGKTQGLESEQAFERGIIRSADLETFKKNPKFAIPHEDLENPPRDLSLYPEHDYSLPNQWAMSIDLNSCIGCNACVIACQAENNIPVVGKEQVIRGREMHWLRVDAYYSGDPQSPEYYFAPVPCMQCENAPCEPVCPVGATVHNHEGLNDMVYNRCIGTRYCSNNCPYKVRRFNFLLFADWDTASLKLMRNPRVTVRSRGVMEKCTYCVQRIRAAETVAEKQLRAIHDGDVQTACQQTCPTDAIIFGNQRDPNAKVAQLKKDPRTYAMLAELNTRPRTTYMAEVRNTNPGLPSQQQNEPAGVHGAEVNHA